MHDQGGLAGADYGHYFNSSYIQLEGILVTTAAPKVAVILLGSKREAERKSSSCWIIV